MSSHSGNRSIKNRKRKPSSPIEDAFLEHTETGVEAAGGMDASAAVKVPTCHEAFVAAANAVGQLYQTAHNSKGEGARAALIKLYECLPENEEEVLSVRQLKRYLMQELNALDGQQDGRGNQGNA